MKATVEKVDPKNLSAVNSYLSKHEESAQFLINNLRERGPNLSSHPSSGNFYLIRAQGEIGGVFCLTRRGNLLAQAEENFAELILQSCDHEPIPLKGFVGDWESMNPIRQLFVQKNPAYRPIYESQEILYAFLLRAEDESLQHDPRVRFLDESDFPLWLEFTKSYLAELKLPDDLSDDQKRTNFLEQVNAKIWWGLFGGSQMLSRCSLNSRGSEIGQVGGVFTPVEHRKQGLAKATMLHMLKDCRDIHQHRKSILFTGQSDFAAQRLYESIGYQRIGFFALILGE